MVNVCNLSTGVSEAEGLRFEARRDCIGEHCLKNRPVPGRKLAECLPRMHKAQFPFPVPHERGMVVPAVSIRFLPSAGR